MCIRDSRYKQSSTLLGRIHGDRRASDHDLGARLDLGADQRQGTSVGSTRYGSDLLSLEDHLGARCQRLQTAQTCKPSIYLAAKMNLGHGLLTQIAALVVVDGALVHPHLLRKGLEVHLPPPAGYAPLYSQCLQALFGRGL